jgi:hypothetical protein
MGEPKDNERWSELNSEDAGRVLIAGRACLVRITQAL